MIKPWKNPSCELAEYFWQYARKTPFYEEIIYKNIIPDNTTNNIINNHITNNQNWLSSKIRGFFLCWRQHGFFYTIKHFIRKCLKKILKG
jgi:hypothetical protein